MGAITSIKISFAAGELNAYIEGVLTQGTSPEKTLGNYKVYFPGGAYGDTTIEALAQSCGEAVKDWVRENIPQPA